MCTGYWVEAENKTENPIEKCSLCRAFSDFHQAQPAPAHSGAPFFPPSPFAHKISA